MLSWWIPCAARQVELTLDDAIIMARRQSVDAAVALDQLKTAYWEWRSWRADRLPEVTLQATIPSYANQYSSFMDSQGEYSFVRNHYLDAQAQLAITQNVWLTGGKISVMSSLDLMHQYGENGGNRFMSIPVAVTLSQPVFGVNHLKWGNRIEPERYAEAKAAFLSATEDVALTTVNLFFSLVMSGANVKIAEQNLENAARLYEVAVEKRKMGHISENDLLQMELNVLEARSTLTDCQSTLKSNMFSLRSFLDFDSDSEIVPVLPGEVPTVSIDYSDALDKALANNKFARNIRRRQLEADYEVAKAKGDLRQINLFAQIGNTGTDDNFAGAYRGLRGNQLVEVGFSIPLLDWGKRRGKVKVAESSRRVLQSQIRRETMDFNQELFVLVERLGNQQRQLEIATRANEIAARRYDTNVKTYLIGQISTLDLNDSQSKKDESRRQYINELYKFWSYWYQLRSLTLYDYQMNADIDADISKIVRN